LNTVWTCTKISRN